MPFLTTKPLTSVTVMPFTPTSDNASSTSSSLNGLIIAVTNFMPVYSLPLASTAYCMVTFSRPLIGTSLTRVSDQNNVNAGAVPALIFMLIFQHIGAWRTQRQLMPHIGVIN